LLAGAISVRPRLLRLARRRSVSFQKTPREFAGRIERVLS
jgi:hypothetical protein